MKTRSLKLPLLAALAVLGIGFAAAPTSAEAGGCQTRYSHKCGSCKSPIHQSYVRIGYQRCGTPIFRWVTNPHTCRHRSSCGTPSHYRSSRGGGFSFSFSTGGYRSPYSYRSSGGYRSPFGYSSRSRCR